MHLCVLEGIVSTAELHNNKVFSLNILDSCRLCGVCMLFLCVDRFSQDTLVLPSQSKDMHLRLIDDLRYRK